MHSLQKTATVLQYFYLYNAEIASQVCLQFGTIFSSCRMLYDQLHLKVLHNEGQTFKRIQQLPLK